MSWVGAGESAAAGAQGGYAHDTTERIDREHAAGHALHAAATKGAKAYITRQLAVNGAGEAVIEYRDPHGRTPLITASRHGRRRCAKLLLGAGAQLEARDVDGYTALCYASACNHPAVVSLLLAAGAQIESANNKGWTSLMNAAYHGASEVVRLLLDAGANTEHRDGNGMTALDLATYRTNAKVVAMINEHALIKRGRVV
jgi:ankyrin repeat protein